MKYIAFSFLLLISIQLFAQKKYIKLPGYLVQEKLNDYNIKNFFIETAYTEDECLFINLKRAFAQQPIRDTMIKRVENIIAVCFKKYIPQGGIKLYVQGRPLKDYIPAIEGGKCDLSRTPASPSSPIIRNIEKNPYQAGLSGNKIALWASHGLYYDQQEERWEWQRSPVFGTVEDLLSVSFITPYLCPMLENAGAEVFMPRERDTQREVIILDNDAKQYKKKGKWTIEEGGFAKIDILKDSVNPFRAGTILKTNHKGAIVEYMPNIRKSGEYAVYVSWGEAYKKSGIAHYTVCHSGGLTHYEVDQRVDGRSWFYLGTFYFNAGHENWVSVENRDDKVISTDAVRFGGGMGRVERNGILSSAPAYQEGARYYLQGAGMPDSIYSPEEYANDYKDDYRSRTMWVNYMKHVQGIPIDLSFAFHTDSGITADSTVIGSLVIFNTDYEKKYNYTDGRSKLAGRDFADIVQTQIIKDLICSFDSCWMRRDMWDKAYNEAVRPDVPAMIVELLAHQNLGDMRYALDPRFRFAASRAIYKGIARFLSQSRSLPCVIQPLAPKAFAIERLSGRKIKLSWEVQKDFLEPTAIPTSYRLYRRVGDNGYDNGAIIHQTSCECELPISNVPFSFRVSAVNDGGESFPSEELSVCLNDEEQLPVLIVNGFTRISGPAIIDTAGFAGIAWWEDEGVADGYDVATLGNQYNFWRSSIWLDNDNSGWGSTDASARNYEIKGNSFNFTKIHGDALQAAGFSYVSCSRAAFENKEFSNEKYKAVDIIMGEQRTTDGFRNAQMDRFPVYTPLFMDRLSTVKIPLLISGAYIGTDFTQNADTRARIYASDTLHYTWRNNIASRSGEVILTPSSCRHGFATSFKFNTAPDAEIYRVESPDAIEPVVDTQTFRLYRYGDTGMSAAVGYIGQRRSIILGFPFETILTAESREKVMGEIMKFLGEN